MKKTKIKDGAKIWHHDEGDYIGDFIARTNNYFEFGILRKLKKLGIFPEGNYIEIGANIGNHILFYKKHTPANKVFAFEPLSDNFILARKNVIENNLKGVEINECGLGNKNEKIKFYVNPHNFGNSSINPQGVDEQKEVEVEIRNISEVLPPLVNKSSFIKIDVEGAEKYFVRELLEIVKEKNITIWIELRSSDYTLDEYISLQQTFRTYGFKLIFNDSYDFVFSSSSDIPEVKRSFREIYNKPKLWRIRKEYDASMSNKELKYLRVEYRELLKEISIRFFERLIWSKLYRFMTGRFFRTK